VVVRDCDRGVERAVVSSPAGAPLLLGEGDLASAPAALKTELTAAGFPAGSYEHAVRVAALRLASEQVRAT
jgi:hypothetical protein